MNINRNNYEAFFLDYRENNLTAAQVAELMVFLEENPDLRETFEAYENVELTIDESVQFHDKEHLKKPIPNPAEKIHKGHYEEKLVARMEGDLSDTEEKELTRFMELNPAIKLEYAIFNKTKLKSDTSIHYPNKDSLKKKGLFVLYRTQVVYSFSIAASVIILLGVYVGFLNQPADRVEDNRVTNLNRIEIIQPDIGVVKYTIPQIFVQNKLSEAEIIPDHEIQNPRDIENGDALASMKAKHIQIIQLPVLAENSEIAIEYRQIVDYNMAASNTYDLPGLQNQEHQKSFFSRFIKGFTKKVMDLEQPQKKSLVEYTIDGYNFLTDRDVEVDKELDENGRVIAYRVNGENISLGRSSKSNTSQ